MKLLICLRIRNTQINIIEITNIQIIHLLRKHQRYHINKTLPNTFTISNDPKELRVIPLLVFGLIFRHHL